jgi:hypothetical protein
MEDRVTRLEREVGEWPDRLREGLEGLEDAARTHVAQTADRIEADVYARDEALRAVLRDKLAGRLRLRWLGVVLLGIALTTTSAVISS